MIECPSIYQSTVISWVIETILPLPHTYIYTFRNSFLILYCSCFRFLLSFLLFVMTPPIGNFTLWVFQLWLNNSATLDSLLIGLHVLCASVLYINTLFSAQLLWCNILLQPKHQWVSAQHHCRCLFADWRLCCSRFNWFGKIEWLCLKDSI